jgi:hypothetical protein
MNREAIIAAVPVRNRSVLIEQDQDVYDIMKCIEFFHKKHQVQYDQFAYRFDVGEVKDIARALWQFCKDNLDYDIETEKKQTVRSPGRMLQEGQGDCKHYASFIAGVLDSLKRQGKDIDWAYRFARYVNWAGKVNNHVFVVITKRNGKEIWIDPVLNYFDYHLPYTSAITKTIATKTRRSVLGCMSNCGCNNRIAGCEAMGSAEDTLLTALKQFEQGLMKGVNDLQKSGTVNQATDAILAMAASTNPYAAAAYAIAKGIQSAAHNLTGAGSVLSRVIDASLEGNILLAPLHIAQQILGGRTYNIDQYFGASDYYFYVTGVDKGASTRITDAEVLPAMKWFIIKTGVFISGRAHINALREGPDTYLAMYKQNPLTTQDRVRVTYASQVVQTYMPANGVAFGWKNTVGVYDDAVSAAIFAARINDPNAQGDTQGVVKTDGMTTTTTSTSNILTSAGTGLGPILLIGGLAALLLTSKR